MKTHCKNYLMLICFVAISLLSTKVNAQHFEFSCNVAEPANWTIYFQGVTLNGVDLESGDEIAVFDADTIAGVFYLTQVCTPTNVFENPLPSYDWYTCLGFIPGNPVFFKCWDASEQIEYSIFSAQYYDPYGGAWTYNIFPEGVGYYSIAEINFTTDQQQQIERSEGYSFISSRIISDNPNIQNILQNNLANLEFVRNSQGLMLQKIGPVWVNNIGDWVNTEGYLFKMSLDDDLVVLGEIVCPTIPIILAPGFQFISYLPEYQLDAMAAFETLIGDSLEYIRNSQGYTLHKIGQTWINGIGDCMPGEAYLVKMNTGDTLIYPFICGNHFTDSRNGQTYNTIQIGNQCWMAKNLNIGEMINGNEEMTNNGVIEKYCYDNDTLNCSTYGGLYQWNEIMEYETTQGTQGLCPDGWHIPTDDEWKILEGTVDSQYPVGDTIWDNTGYRGFDAGHNLKSQEGWNSTGNGSNAFGFKARPGGWINNGYFHSLLFFSMFWSSTEIDSNLAYKRGIYLSYQIIRSQSSKSKGYSLRCIKN